MYRIELILEGGTFVDVRPGQGVTLTLRDAQNYAHELFNLESVKSAFVYEHVIPLRIVSFIKE